MQASVILTAYKNADLLRRCLAAYSRTSKRPDEIIIAEDDNELDLDDLLRDCRASKISYKHVQQEDIGFRRSKILNKAIHVSSGKLLITTDCDCLPHNQFVHDHLKYARVNHYNQGPRAYVKEHRVQGFSTSFLHRLKLSLRNDLYPKKVAFRLPFQNWDSNYHPIGCNFACWKEDCIKVNGFNESFEGWGYEDLDLIARLKNIGIREQKFHQRCIVYHLNHPIRSRDQESANKQKFELTIEEKHTSCEQGIDQYRDLAHDSIVSAQCVF